MKKVLAFLIISVLLISCEQVITIDLDVAEPHIVIEGVVSNLDGGVFIRLTQTTSYYYPHKSPPPIMNATVRISDNLGYSEILTESDSGYYEAQIMKGVPGRTYALRIDIDGKIYEAESTMKSIPVLDSLTFQEELYFDINNQSLDTTYIATCHFIDPPDSEDNYRIKLYAGKNARLRKYYYLFEDTQINGDTIHYGAYGRYKRGAKAKIELLNVDQNVYDYYHILSQVQNTSINSGSTISSAPENPPSNISNGALGYFGAIAIAYVDTIVE